MVVAYLKNGIVYPAEVEYLELVNVVRVVVLDAITKDELKLLVDSGIEVFDSIEAMQETWDY